MSREKKFTPGPWTVVDRAGYTCIRNDSNLIDTTITDDILTNSDDANLIAAAPELLEALEMIMDDSPASLLAYQDAMEKAKAAIKKAYGETK